MKLFPFDTCGSRKIDELISELSYFFFYLRVKLKICKVKERQRNESTMEAASTKRLYALHSKVKRTNIGK